MRAKHLATLVGAQPSRRLSQGHPLPPQNRTNLRSRAKQRQRLRPCARRREMSRSTTRLRQWITTHTAEGPGCYEREVDDHANNTQAHRTAARGSRSCGGDRSSAGGGRRRTGRNGPAVPAQSVLRATGRRRIQMRITGQRSAERCAAGHQFLPSRGRLESHISGLDARPRIAWGSGRRLIVVTQNFKPRPRF